MSPRLKVAIDPPQLPMMCSRNVDSVGPQGRAGQGRADFPNSGIFLIGPISSSKSTGADSRQRDSGGAPCLLRESTPESTRRMSVKDEQCQSMKLDEGEVGSLEEGSLAVPRLQEGRSSGRLLSGYRRVKDEVGDPSKAPGSASKGSQGHAKEACLARWPVGITSLLGL